MKKVLLTSAAVLALFAAAAPAVADINGGANTPGAYDQPTTGGGVNDAYNAQTEFENARKVNEYLAGHQEDIDALMRLKADHTFTLKRKKLMNQL